MSGMPNSDSKVSVSQCLCTYVCACLLRVVVVLASQKVVIKNALVFQAYLNLDGDLVSRQIRPELTRC